VGDLESETLPAPDGGKVKEVAVAAADGAAVRG
jgi:hypothetical protein